MQRVWLLAILAVPSLALAVDVDPFDASASLAHKSGTPSTDSPRLTGAGLSAGLYGTVAHDLMVFVNADGTEERLAPHAFSTTLYGGWTFEDRARIDVMAPLYWHTRSDIDEPFAGAAMGDVLIQGNVRIHQNESGTFGFSVLPTLGVPTGRPKAMVARGAHFRLRGAVGGEINDRFGYAANLGFTLQRGQPVRDIAVGSSVDAAVGAWVHLDDNLRVGADFEQRLGTSNAPGISNSINWSHLFAQTTSDDGLGLMVGAGTSFLQGVGAPNWRVTTAITYAKIVRDKDKDGIVDKLDACPLDPEDVDGFEDLDGCPESDNDQDTILDLDDACPDQPEDFDSYEDLDGCPDPDNDGDGILDTDDSCPYVPGIEAFAGCPDTDSDGLTDADDQCPLDAGPEALIGCPDTDQDEVPDFRDACPGEPRTADEPVNQSNGCPRKAFVQGDRIQITDRVLFETGKDVIRAESFSLLDDVIDTLRRYPQIRSIEIAGHTDNVGSERSNLRLSQRRAASVMRFLTERSVDAGRLTSQGYGESEPIAPNFTDTGKQKNRRVEFRILAQDPVTEEVDSGLGADLGGVTVRLPSDRPFTSVEVDGTLASARAPFRGLIVTPWGHTVRVVDPDRGLDFSTEIEIEGGRTVVVEVPADAVTNPEGTGGPPQPIPLAEDAPLALPVDGAEPADGIEPTDTDEPEQTPLEGAGTAEPAQPSEVDLLPKADPMGADLLPKADLGTLDDGSRPSVDGDDFPVTSEPVLDAGDPNDPWGTSAAPATTPEPEPAVEEPAVQTGPGFGQADETVVAGPGFGAVETDPKAAKAAEKAEKKAAKAAAKAAKEAAKEAAKAEKQGSGVDPLVDPSTLPGASEPPADDAAPGAEPKPEPDDEPAPSDDPWSQPG